MAKFKSYQYGVTIIEKMLPTFPRNQWLFPRALSFHLIPGLLDNAIREFSLV